MRYILSPGHAATGAGEEMASMRQLGVSRVPNYGKRSRNISLDIKSQITARGIYKLPRGASLPRARSLARSHLLGNDSAKNASDVFRLGLQQIILSSALLTVNDDPDAPYFIRPRSSLGSTRGNARRFLRARRTFRRMHARTQDTFNT